MIKEHGRKQDKTFIADTNIKEVDITEVYRDKDILNNEALAQQATKSPILRARSRRDFSHFSTNDDSTYQEHVSVEYRASIVRGIYSGDWYKTKDQFTEIFYLIRDSFFGRRESIFAHYNPLEAVPQVGSQCGFVALSMASQLLKRVCTDKLVDDAKTLGLTQIGEMFNAYEMAEFASTQLQCESSVMCDLFSRKYDLLSHICDGWPVLIPYDQYGSFPGKYKGEKAHWAVLNGLFFSVGLTVDPSRQLRFISSSRGEYVKEKLLYDCRRYTPDSDIFVLAREGTREHTLAWRIDALLVSNQNLENISPVFGLNRSHDLSNLRDKAVLLKKRG